MLAQVRSIDAALQKANRELNEKDSLMCAQEQSFVERTSRITTSLEDFRSKTDRMRLEMQAKDTHIKSLQETNQNVVDQYQRLQQLNCTLETELTLAKNSIKKKEL